MTDVLPPPTTTDVEENASTENTRDSLAATLDELLKRYLLLLDQYTQTRLQLSSDLSSGYISLAQANFNTSNRVRYGQDFYDERMQALRRVTVPDPDSKPNPTIALTADSADSPTTTATPTHKGADDDKDTSSSTDPSTTADSTITASLAHLDLNTKPEDTTSEPDAKQHQDKPKTTKQDQEQKKRHDDPIRWFGILVPPALRSAQGSFVRAVEGPVPTLVGLAAELRGLEVEIGRARKAVRKSLG